MSDNWGFDTRQIHAGAEADPTTGARATPIYQTTAYQFRDTEHAANLFALGEIGNIYTRIMNPTQGVAEARIASLEGAPDTAVGLPGALVVASGQAAETMAILNLAETGSHIVSSAALYGGTYNLFHYTLPKFGVEVTFIEDPDDLDAWRAAVRPNTKAFYAESIGNPRNDVLDISAVADLAHEHGVPLIVDNTAATPYLVRPLEHGADIVVHSATKFLGGHGTAIAGAIVDGGSFDFSANDKFPMFTEPDPSYHGLHTGRHSARAPTSSRPGCSCCVTWAQRCRRSMPSCCSRASRRCRCAWIATARTPSRSPSSSRRTTRSNRSPTPGSPRAGGTRRRSATPPRAPARCRRS